MIYASKSIWDSSSELLYPFMIYVEVFSVSHFLLNFALWKINKCHLWYISVFCVCVYYVVRKKAQLKKKRGVPQINEQMLFHGTSSEFVEAICIHNFDWRINGIHGALFGKGNYQNSRSSSSPRNKYLFRDNGLFYSSGVWSSLSQKLLY